MNFKQKLSDLRAGKRSATQNAQDFLAEIEKNNKKYNIFLEIFKEEALKRANSLDKALKEGKTPGKLFGVCIALKSNISYKEATISCASHTLENYKGSFNADVVEKLLAEDAIIIGMLNNDEFASGSSGETSAFLPTQNPFSPSRVPGGSSSGSAAVIAANMCDIALGSDTGGSIRLPASFCNVVGIKPSYGRVSRYGLVDLSMSLDQIGPLSHDVYGSALAMEVISGESEYDATTQHWNVEEYSSVSNQPLKIGIPKELIELIKDKEILDSFNDCISKLKEQGHSILEVSLQHADLGIQAYYPIVYTEFFSGTRKFDSVKYGKKIEDAAGEEVLRRIFGGKEISRSEFDGAYYKKALKVKEIIAKEFEEVFSKVDVIVIPTSPKLPHRLGEKITTEEMYAYDAFTIPSNLAGICAGSVPFAVIEKDSENLAIGMQVMANKAEESKLFQGLFAIESLQK